MNSSKRIFLIFFNNLFYPDLIVKTQPLDFILSSPLRTGLALAEVSVARQQQLINKSKLDDIFVTGFIRYIAFTYFCRFLIAVSGNICLISAWVSSLVVLLVPRGTVSSLTVPSSASPRPSSSTMLWLRRAVVATPTSTARDSTGVPSSSTSSLRTWSISRQV